MLMAENFIGALVSDLYVYTNPNTDETLRMLIAESLTWAGLNSTPE
jgi:hypothetical protein